MGSSIWGLVVDFGWAKYLRQILLIGVGVKYFKLGRLMAGVKVGWWALVGAGAVLLLLVYCPHGTPTPHLTRFTTWTYTRFKVMLLLFSNWGFCSNRILRYFPMSVSQLVTGVTSQVFWIIWLFRRCKPYALTNLITRTTLTTQATLKTWTTWPPGPPGPSGLPGLPGTTDTPGTL